MVGKYKTIKLKNGTTRDEHRIVMEEHLGRRLERTELIHHINGNKSDNRVENLELTNRKTHAKEHSLGISIRPKERILFKNGGTICQKCGANKKIKDFCKDNRRPKGVNSQCKSCRNEYKRDLRRGRK